MDKHSNQNSKDISGASVRKLWFRSDMVVIFALLTIAALIYFVYAAVTEKGGKTYCEFVLDGEVVMTEDLAGDKSFSLEGLPNVTFEIRNGAIAFIKSDCPDKVCINIGYLHMAGQTAACLPNHAVIRIKADGDADTPDVVV